MDADTQKDEVIPKIHWPLFPDPCSLTPDPCSLTPDP